MNVIASMGNDKKNAAARFLIYSFIGLLIFSIAVFSLLGIYMNRKSRDTICEVGEIYMSGMNEQMSGHFESVIELRFSQVCGIASVVSSDNRDKEKLYEELVYRAQVRDFDYVALCSAGGKLEMLYGQPIQPINPDRSFIPSFINPELFRPEQQYRNHGDNHQHHPCHCRAIPRVVEFKGLLVHIDAVEQC